VAFIHDRKLKNGKTVYQVRYRGSDNRERSRQFDRKRDAEAFCDSVATDVRAGTWIDPAKGKLTINDYAPTWLAGRVDLKASSYAKVKRDLYNRVLPRFGTVALADLTHADCQAWVAELSRSGLAARTVWRYVGVLGQVMDAAVRDRRILVSPAARLRLPKAIKTEMRCLNPDEIATLVDACEPDWFAVLVLFDAYTALRISEVLGLRWGRVNLLKRTLKVREAAVEVDGKVVMEPTPKTDAGWRTVPMPAFVADALAGLVDGPPDPDALVFPNRHGRPFLSSGLRNTYWYKAVKKSGLGHVRPHDLRHSGISLWVSTAETVAVMKELQVRAGHESFKTFWDTYAHLLPGHVHSGMDALNAMGLAAAQATSSRRRV
jgi:integrase